MNGENNELNTGQFVVFLIRCSVTGGFTELVQKERCQLLTESTGYSEQSILSKSKGEGTRLDGLGTNNLYTEFPRPYATLKFEEDTDQTYPGSKFYVTLPVQSNRLEALRHSQKNNAPKIY